MVRPWGSGGTSNRLGYWGEYMTEDQEDILFEILLDISVSLKIIVEALEAERGESEERGEG